MGGGSGSTVPGNQLPVVFENLRDPERCDPMTASSSAHVLWQLQTLLFNQHSTEYTTRAESAPLLYTRLSCHVSTLRSLHQLLDSLEKLDKVADEIFSNIKDRVRSTATCFVASARHSKRVQDAHALCIITGADLCLM